MSNKFIFVEVKDVIANAMVEMCEQKNIRCVNIHTIYEYGETVAKAVSAQLNTHAEFLFSDVYVTEFLRDYSDYFEMFGSTIYKKVGVTTEDIRNHILSYTPIDVLNGLFAKEAIRVLGLE